MMGVELNIQNNVDHQMMISCDRFLNIVTNRFYKFWLYPDFIYKRTKAFVQQTKDTNYIVDFARNVLSKIKEDQVIVSHVEDEDKPLSFISQLLKISRENDAFDNIEVIAETLTAIMAVSDFFSMPMFSVSFLNYRHLIKGMSCNFATSAKREDWNLRFVLF
jgi:hypothetical protein